MTTLPMTFLAILSKAMLLNDFDVVETVVLLQAAFECMYTLLDSCLDRLDIFEFLNHLEDGLKDHYDVKVS